jgi:hypothetical protein
LEKYIDEFFRERMMKRSQIVLATALFLNGDKIERGDH